jgi:hypothetical protein
MFLPQPTTDVWKPDERRATGRAVSILRVARLVTDAGDQLCVVRNVSPTGMMVDVAEPPRPGEHVAVEFSSEVRVQGTVRWAIDDRFGVELDTETDLLKAFDQAPGRLRRRQPRSPRFARSAPARIATTRKACEGTVRTVSLNGLSVAFGGDEFVRGDRVKIRVSGLPRRDGEVRWVKAGVAGIWFERPLPLHELAQWLRETRGLA